MAKKYNRWFKCYFCPLETDEGRLVEYQGKIVEICLRCYKDKIYLKEKRNGMDKGKQKDKIS